MIGRLNRLGISGKNIKIVPPQIPVITIETNTTKASFQVSIISPVVIDWDDGNKEEVLTFNTSHIIAHIYDNIKPRIVKFYSDSDAFKSIVIPAYNKATAADLSKAPFIQSLYLSGNLITRMSVIDNLKLGWFEIDNNPIVTDDVELSALAVTLADRSKGSKATITLRNAAQAGKIKDILTARNWIAR